MGTRPRNKSTQGSWSDSRIDGNKPFNLKFYPNATTMDRWIETSFRSRGGALNISKNSFSVEKMCYNQGMGGRDYKGCYYPIPRNYTTPTLIFTLHNDKGQNVGYTNTTYHKQNLTDTFYGFNPQNVLTLSEDRIDQRKLGNDGKVYGKAFVALFPALPDIPQIHPSYYETHSAESAQKFFTKYNEAQYLSQQDGKLASNIVNFQIQYNIPIPTITVKKKQVIVR